MTRAQEPAELRPGLPPVELRRVWRTWETSVLRISFTADGTAWAWGGPDDADKHHFSVHNIPIRVRAWSDLLFSPAGASWSEVEALAAKAAEVRS